MFIIWQFTILCEVLPRLKAYYSVLDFYSLCMAIRVCMWWERRKPTECRMSLKWKMLMKLVFFSWKTWLISNYNILWIFFKFIILTLSLLSKNNWVVWVSLSNRRIHWCMQYKRARRKGSRSNGFWGVAVGERWSTRGHRYEETCLRHIPLARDLTFFFLLNACKWFHDLFSQLLISRGLYP